jgi:hypothetical protein
VVRHTDDVKGQAASGSKREGETSVCALEQLTVRQTPDQAGVNDTGPTNARNWLIAQLTIKDGRVLYERSGE